MGTGSVWKKEEENLIAIFMSVFNSAIFVKIEKGGDVIVAVGVFFGTVSAEEVRVFTAGVVAMEAGVEGSVVHVSSVFLV